MPITALLTGGAGTIASGMRPHLAERGWRVRLLDVVEPAAAPGPDETVHVGSVLDDALLAEASAGVDLVIHLAAHAAEREWADILSLNIDATARVLRAASDAGVRRVLYASSIHAVGFAPRAAAREHPVLLPRPDSLYGASKAASEALCSVWADRFDMAIVSARIVNANAWLETPMSRICWFSPADAARLAEATARLTTPGHRIVWGVSRAGGRLFPLGPGREIGFDPRDDATLPGDDVDDGSLPLGGDFTARPLGVPWS